jgi:hypothetical protein
VAERYLEGDASQQELIEAYEEAAVEKFGVEAWSLSLEDCANSLSCSAANPNIERSISDCFNGYALGMNRLGMTIKRAEELQLQKFLELVR